MGEGGREGGREAGTFSKKILAIFFSSQGNLVVHHSAEKSLHNRAQMNNC